MLCRISKPPTHSDSCDLGAVVWGCVQRERRVAGFLVNPLLCLFGGVGPSPQPPPRAQPRLGPSLRRFEQNGAWRQGVRSVPCSASCGATPRWPVLAPSPHGCVMMILSLERSTRALSQSKPPTHSDIRCCRGRRAQGAGPSALVTGMYNPLPWLPCFS